MNFSRYHLVFFSHLSLFTPLVMAGEPLVFKQPFTPKNSWLTYGSAIIMLLILVIVIAKKHKPGATQKPICQLVEKKYLGNKTVIYIIEYQQQRFLLADNQQALALHPLIQEATDEQG